jgi:hypothetical protein
MRPGFARRSSVQPCVHCNAGSVRCDFPATQGIRLARPHDRMTCSGRSSAPSWRSCRTPRRMTLCDLWLLLTSATSSRAGSGSSSSTHSLSPDERVGGRVPQRGPGELAADSLRTVQSAYRVRRLSRRALSSSTTSGPEVIGAGALIAASNVSRNAADSFATSAPDPYKDARTKPLGQQQRQLSGVVPQRARGGQFPAGGDEQLVIGRDRLFWRGRFGHPAHPRGLCSAG